MYTKKAPGSLPGALWITLVLATIGLRRRRFRPAAAVAAAARGAGSGAHRFFHRYRFAFGPAVEDQLLLVADLLDLDLDDALAVELTLEQLFGQRVFDERLDRPAQRTRAVIG